MSVPLQFMPHIVISFFGLLQEARGEGSRKVEVPEGTRVDDLLEELGFEETEMLRACIMVNGKRCELTAEVQDHDKVEVTLFAAGG